MEHFPLFFFLLFLKMFVLVQSFANKYCELQRELQVLFIAADLLCIVN